MYYLYMKIVIASLNPVKINASVEGFKKIFADVEVMGQGISIPSGVSDQPMSDQETYLGALNRANGAKQAVNGTTNTEYWIGIEGGLEIKNGEMEAFAWVVIIDRAGKIGKARTSTFFLPKAVSDLVNQGKELGEADDMIFGRTNSKQGNGTVGILTGDVIDRTQYYTEAVVLALIPFKNSHLYT